MNKRLIAQTRNFPDSENIISVQEAMDVLQNQKINWTMKELDKCSNSGKFAFRIDREKIIYYYLECYQISNDKSLIIYRYKQGDNEWSSINNCIVNITARMFNRKQNHDELLINGNIVFITLAKTIEELQHNMIR